MGLAKDESSAGLKMNDCCEGTALLEVEEEELETIRPVKPFLPGQEGGFSDVRVLCDQTPDDSDEDEDDDDADYFDDDDDELDEEDEFEEDELDDEEDDDEEDDDEDF